MMLPCMVNHWLYVASLVKVLLGTASWVRMASARSPASRKKEKAVTMYMIPIFL